MVASLSKRLPINLHRMYNMLLQLQLDNELAIYATLTESARKDAIAQIVLNRLSLKINALQELIDEENNRKISAKHKHSYAIVCYVRQALHRLRNHKNGRNNSLFQIPAKDLLQKTGTTR